MDLDRVLNATFRNYSTLFLVVFALLFPLHLVYGWVFQDVLAVRELHPAISQFPPARQVRGVGQTQVEQARLWFWILIVLEIALLPLIVKACRSVLEQERKGEVTNAIAALSSIRSKGPHGTARPSSGAVVAALAIAIAVAALAEITFGMAADFLPDTLAFATLALASAVGRACGIPIAAVALASTATADTGSAEVPDLY